jgi:opacity protein-like surface antigen
MHRPLTALLALASLPLAEATRADGIYIGANAGYTIMESMDSTGAIGGTTEIEAKDGYAVRGAIGYEFRPFRAEIELGYSENEVDTLSGSVLTNRSATGDVKVGAAMLNGYFDIPLSLLWLRPYVGAGLGYARAELENVAGLGFTTIDDDDTTFAYQFIGGIAFEIVKPIVAFGEYRYFATSSFDLTNRSGVAQDVDGVTIHSFNVGARIHF